MLFQNNQICFLKQFDDSIKDFIEFYCEKLEKEKPNEIVTEWFTDVVQEKFLNYIHSKVNKQYFLNVYHQTFVYNQYKKDLLVIFFFL